MINILKTTNKSMTKEQIGRLLSSKHGFADSSASPIISKLMKAKKIAAKDGKYALVK